MDVRTVGLALLVLLSSPSIATSALAEEPRTDEARLEIGVYGDVRYSHFDYGPDQKSGDHGSPPDNRATIDIPTLSLELEYPMKHDVSLEAEVEFEHGGTGAAMELEFEEFGEFETEVEKGGEISLEELHLTKSFGEGVNIRAGHFITAVGLANRSRRPVDFFTTAPAEAEASVIPITWDETGIELFGKITDLHYRLQLINGLDSSGFSSKFWIAGGKQNRFEGVKATDMALAGRLDWDRGTGLLLGGSAYYGDTNDNRPKPDMPGVAGHVALVDVHAVVDRGPVRGRALGLYGTLENADVISAKNSRLSSQLEVPRTPVAKAAYAWYAEIGYDVVSLLHGNATWKLYPFAHYERYDTMAEVDSGIFADPRFKRTVAAAGLTVLPSDDVVVKLEASHRELGSDQFNDENTISLDVGFATDLLAR